MQDRFVQHGQGQGRAAFRRSVCEQLADRRHQGFGRYGPRQKSFCAEFQREAFVLRIVVPPRIEDEGDRLQAFVLLPFTAQGEAVHARQHDVRNDHVRRFAARRVERRKAVRRPHDAMTLAGQQLLERALL